MVRVLLDTNVLVSGLANLNADSPPSAIVRAWRAGRFELLVSDAVISEASRTFTKPYFARRLTLEEATNAIQLLVTHAVWTEVLNVLSGVATHPEDDLVLSAAVDGDADYVVTGDLKLQRLGTLGSCQICSPAEFVMVLNRDETS